MIGVCRGPHLRVHLRVQSVRVRRCPLLLALAAAAAAAAAATATATATATVAASQVPPPWTIMELDPFEGFDDEVLELVET